LQMKVDARQGSSKSSLCIMQRDNFANFCVR
jgi:hypothetical protein